MKKSNVSVLPDDSYNRQLVQNVHPPDWVNPQPKEKYHLAVIGAGTAGLISALAGAAVGATVALVEKHLLGGDCLNVGCVPSKGLIRASRAFADVRDAHAFGVDVPPGAKVDFPKMMERMRRLRSHISRNDSAKRYAGFGIDVFLGEARFLDKNSIQVGESRLNFSRAVVATGARAATLPIPGLQEVGYLTNESIFTLTRLPARFGVIGSGPIGCEMAQAFARFGSKVIVLERSGHVLPREEEDAAAAVEKAFEKDGVVLLKKTAIKSIDKRGADKVIHIERADDVIVDEILLGIGRAPNVEGLNLEAAGVQYDGRKGVTVNDYLQTTNPKIFAAGDVCFPYKFTHTAEAMASIVIQNAFFSLGPLGKKKSSDMIIPWCTYTDPEVAHVGLYEQDAGKKGIEIETFLHPFTDVDRAILDGEEEGFVKILAKKGTGEILGATIVARHAGEMISELTVAMNGKVNLSTIAGVIHPYPTQSEGIKRAGGHFRKTKLTPTVKKWMTRWINWTS